MYKYRQKPAKRPEKKTRMKKIFLPTIEKKKIYYLIQNFKAD